MAVEEKKRSICGVCIHNGCGIYVKTLDGRPVEIEPDFENPFSYGFLCEKSAIAIDQIDHPSRLNYPLKRAGERGEGKWKRISWEQAMDEIAAKLAGIRDKYGPEAVVSPGGTCHGIGADIFRPTFMNFFGSPNWYWQGINCGAAMMASMAAVAGWQYLSLGIPGITKSFLVWGVNPVASSAAAWPMILEAQKQGAKMIVIDPILTETASYADIWVQIRPGTDGALAMGMINVIITEKLYDEEFIRDWTVGFDELKDRVKPYTPARVEEITGVPQQTVIEISRIFATEKPGSLFGHLPWIHIGAGAANSACIYTAILPALTGNIDVLGGCALGFPFEDAKLHLESISGWQELYNHPLRKRDVVGEEKIKKGVAVCQAYDEVISKVHPWGLTVKPYLLFPALRAIWDAILEEKPYPIKAMLAQGTNLLSCHANTPLVYKALKSKNLELYVNMDVTMSPAAALADYVLPASGWMERPQMRTMMGILGTIYQGASRVMEPLYERHDDYQLWADLGKRLGQEKYWPERMEDKLSQMVEPWGMDFDTWAKEVKWYLPEPEDRPYLKINPATGKPRGFPTRSGKLELRPSLLEVMRQDPLPDYEEPLQSPVSTPDLAQEYPLILMTGNRSRFYVHGEFREYDKVRRFHHWPKVDIHPATARDLGIADGEAVWVETPRGRVRQIAHINSGIKPGVVHAEAYWWYPEKAIEEPILGGAFESNANAILDDDYPTLNFGGDNYLRALLCKVYPAKQPPGR